MSDPAGTALFPISLSNQAFSTERVLQLLPPLFACYGRILFLVADRLQIYNKALRVGDEVRLADVIRGFDAKQRYVEERRRWIERLTANVPLPAAQKDWTVIGAEDLADADCYRIFRNVMLAYYALETFRTDVDEAATRHAETRDDRFPSGRSQQLSRGYLLEEIALSIRLHVIEGIFDEFYLGQQAPPVLRLYNGDYGLCPEDLAEVDGPRNRHRFFSLTEEAGENWTEVSSAQSQQWSGSPG